MNIYVYSGSTLIASGTLDVDNSTFTPDGGSEVTCSSLNWSTADNGVTDFSFVVSDLPNGGFPPNGDGSAYTYQFSGTENATATEASGTVPFPGDAVSIKDGGGDPPVWQTDSTEGKPISRGTAAK